VIQCLYELETEEIRFTAAEQLKLAFIFHHDLLSHSRDFTNGFLEKPRLEAVSWGRYGNNLIWQVWRCFNLRLEGRTWRGG
jgi:hypothetical protein